MKNGNNVNFKKSVQPKSSLSQNQRIVAIFRLMEKFNISEKEAEEILNRLEEETAPTKDAKPIRKENTNQLENIDKRESEDSKNVLKHQQDYDIITPQHVLDRQEKSVDSKKETIKPIPKKEGNLAEKPKKEKTKQTTPKPTKETKKEEKTKQTTPKPTKETKKEEKTKQTTPKKQIPDNLIPGIAVTQKNQLKNQKKKKPKKHKPQNQLKNQKKKKPKKHKPQNQLKKKHPKRTLIH